MSYSIETTKNFDKKFKKLDRGTQLIIKGWIKKHLVNCDNPRSIGKALIGDKKGLWRYRIGDYRLLCTIEDDRLVIIALNIGHRRDIYNN